MKDRIKKICNALNVRVSDFERSIGVANGYVNSMRKGMGQDKLSVFIEKYPNVNVEWLMTGHGHMFKVSNKEKGDNKVAVNNRVLEAINYILDSGIEKNKSTFAQRIGIKQAKFSEIMSQRMSAGIDIIQKLCNDYNISANWILLGEGSMLHTEKGNSLNKSAVDKNKVVIEDNAIILSAKNTNGIPLVEQTAVAGFGNADFAINDADIKSYYVIPKFRNLHIDFMIELSGTSMYPTYNSGDIVACTVLRESQFIQWNKCHIVATREQGILCKRILQSDNTEFLKIVSDNPEYPSVEIPKNEITGIALIVGLIRLE